METKRVMSFFALACNMAAQETRWEIVNAAPKPEEDAKANSASAPDVYAIAGRFDRVLDS